jgi:hypothetical protein
MSHRVDRGVPAMECGLGGRVPVPVSGSVFGHRDFAILNADLRAAAVVRWECGQPNGRPDDPQVLAESPMHHVLHAHGDFV